MKYNCVVLFLSQLYTNGYLFVFQNIFSLTAIVKCSQNFLIFLKKAELPAVCPGSGIECP